MTRDALLALSKEDLVALVLAQQARIEALTAQVAALTEQVAALQARLKVPPKTPDNSSTPPRRERSPTAPIGPASAVVLVLVLPAPWPNTRITSSR
jgi:transposase